MEADFPPPATIGVPDVDLHLHTMREIQWRNQ